MQYIKAFFMLCLSIHRERWQFLLFRKWCTIKTQCQTMDQHLFHISNPSWSFLDPVLKNSVFHVCWSQNLQRDSHNFSWYPSKTGCTHRNYIYTMFIYAYQHLWLFLILFPFQIYVYICTKTPISRFILAQSKEALRGRKRNFQDKQNQDILNFTLSWNLHIELQSNN